MLKSSFGIHKIVLFLDFVNHILLIMRYVFLFGSKKTYFIQELTYYLCVNSICINKTFLFSFYIFWTNKTVLSPTIILSLTYVAPLLDSVLLTSKNSGQVEQEKMTIIISQGLFTRPWSCGNNMPIHF